MKWKRLPLAAPRKILCAAVLAASVALLLPAAANAAKQRLVRADLFQTGQELVFTVRTAEPVPLAKLDPLPRGRRSASDFLCFALIRSSTEERHLLCLGGRSPHRRIGLLATGEDGRIHGRGSIAATVTRPVPRKLVVAIDPADAGLSPRRYRWAVAQGIDCDKTYPCIQELPDHGTNGFRIRPVRAVGCTGGSPGLVTNGPRDRRVVALTFDDGPSDYTDDFLSVLREKDVQATFFEVGQVMPGREDVMREILAQGSELADHTMDHVELPGYSQIAGAAARIRAYTHFQPCLFRPPGGAVDDGVVATAGSFGMRTVNWDVDPRDWSNPGVGAIYANVVGHVRPGSIVVMHDGGGPRSETLAALPQIIDTLRGRGYRFATVTELLGGRILYRPYG
ncbi:MAG: polysaccharide deacetylase family protein [Solirubrobacterales bacterium]